MQENTKPMDVPLAPHPGSALLTRGPTAQFEQPVRLPSAISSGVLPDDGKSLGTEKGKEDQKRVGGRPKKKGDKKGRR